MSLKRRIGTYLLIAIATGGASGMLGLYIMDEPVKYLAVNIPALLLAVWLFFK